MFLRRSLMALFLSFGLAGAAHAEFLIGLAHIGGITGPNLEWAAKRHTLYAVPGVHLGSGGLEDDVRWVAGSRFRLDRGFTNTSGFYSGVMLGDMGGERTYERLGVGLEIGHQWVKEYVRTTVSATLAVTEELKCGDYLSSAQCDTPEKRKLNDKDMEPSLLLGITISLRK